MSIHLNSIQSSYLAGFWDGDGSIIAQLVFRQDYKYKYQIRLTLQLTQLKKRKWFLEQIKDLIGAGYIRDREHVSDYILVETSLVFQLLTLIQPYLRIKQKQANLVIKIIQQLPYSRDSLDHFLNICQLVDQVAFLNDTKKRKHTFQTVSAMLKDLKINALPVETQKLK